MHGSETTNALNSFSKSTLLNYSDSSSKSLLSVSYDSKNDEFSEMRRCGCKDGGQIPQIVIVDSINQGYVIEPHIEKAYAAERAKIKLLRVLSERELIPIADSIDVLINWHKVPLPSSIIEKLSNCRGIVRAAVGYDNIDIKRARELGVSVANVPDYGTDEVADHTLALMLVITRGLIGAHKEVQNFGWDWRYNSPRVAIKQRTIGIVGLGRIGIAVARRAAAFGLNINFYDPYLPSGIEKSLSVNRSESLQELLKVSNILTLHTPLSAETDGFIGVEELALLPPNAIVLNTSRGGVLKLDALRKFLDNGHLLGAGVDVLEHEPTLPAWIVDHPRVVVTPHSAFYSDRSLQELRERSVQIALQFAEGKTPREVVN